jgi:hypothetical protein
MERELKKLEDECDKACAEWLDAGAKSFDARFCVLGDTSETERDKARAEFEKAHTRMLVAERAEHSKKLQLMRNL